MREEIIETLKRVIHNAKVAHHRTDHYETAIRYIEAWDEVRQEINEELSCGYPESDSEDIRYGLMAALAIIERHLQEVEHG